MVGLSETASRRTLLSMSGKTLGVAGLAVLLGAGASGCAQLSPVAAQDPEQDIEILNAAIALEHEGIAARILRPGFVDVSASDGAEDHEVRLSKRPPRAMSHGAMEHRPPSLAALAQDLLVEF